MSRKIEYRVYSNSYKKYLDTSGKGIFCEVHHLALKPDGKLYYADIGIEYPGTLSECPTLEWEEDYGDCVVEQYTGLKDKNGKEIYEGDIVKARWHRAKHARLDTKGEVKFDNGWFYIEDDPDGQDRLGVPVHNCYNIEVIGNIHENSELLGGK